MRLRPAVFATAAAVAALFGCVRPSSVASHQFVESAVAEESDAGALDRAPSPLSYCALGMAVLHSRSPRFGKHFERLAKMQRRLPRLAVFVGIDDAGSQPCIDEMFQIVGEHDAPPQEMGPTISLRYFDGGLWWAAGTNNLNPLDWDGGVLHEMELSGGMNGLAYVVDGGWVICNDCKPPGWKPDE
jgi:hypothetical protein